MTRPLVIAGAGTSYRDVTIESTILADTGAEVLDGRLLSDAELRAIAPRASAILTDYFACDAELIASLEHCLVLASYGVGYDQIDVAAADRAGIIVTNNPDYCVTEMAEHTIALMLSAMRRIPGYDAHVRAGGWDYLSQPAPSRVEGSVLGLVGFGRIGRRVAATASALGMKVIVHDPWLQNAPADVRLVELDELLGSSDVVSLHLPLSPQTRHLIGAEQLALMKPSAGLINAARGGLLDARALEGALDAGTIAWAALDALDPEPPASDEPLLGRSDTIITPHAGFYSELSLQLAQENAAYEVRRILLGEAPASPVGKVRVLDRVNS